MQHVDRPHEVESLSIPPRCRRARVDVEPERVVPRAHFSDRIGGHRGGGRDAGELSALRRAEAEIAVCLACQSIALLVYRTMVAATERCEIRQGRRTTVRPVADVMALPEPRAASGEATALVAVLQRSP
jgi:hypothetical protein